MTNVSTSSPGAHADRRVVRRTEPQGYRVAAEKYKSSANLPRAGILLSAGHSEASFAQTMQAIAHGLRGFTHLFNAMARLEPRDPGIVGAALYDENT